MTLKIDDAGWGALIGGVIIGIHDDLTGEYHSKEIPVSFFQGYDFAAKRYLYEGSAIAFDLIQKHWPKYKGDILCGTGYCLNEIYTTLLANQYKIERGKITGTLQDQIDMDLLTNLRTAGLDIDYSMLTEHHQKGLFWYSQIKWLKDGDVNSTANPSKIKLCKTGWITFSTWAKLPYHDAKIRAQIIKNSTRSGRRNYGNLR